MATQMHFRSPDLSDRAVEIETLLSRYPDLTEAELASLIRAFKHLPLLDFGLLAADERIGGKLDAFYSDHGHELRSPVGGVTWTMAIAAAVAIGLLLWALV